MNSEEPKLPLLSKVEFSNRIISGVQPPIPFPQQGEWKPEGSKVKMDRGTFAYRDIKGVYHGTDLRFSGCVTPVWNRLLYPDGTPVSASGASYFFSSIQWCPGVGWQTYSSRCPLPDYSPSMLIPTAKRHQLVVQLGGYAFFECNNSYHAHGNQVTDVFVGVNDDKFDDNTGSFDFILSAITR